MVFGKGEKTKETYKDPELDRELPFAITLITLMASAGISPYESFRKLKNMDLLPATQKRSKDIVRQVEVLGEDPLSVIENNAKTSGSNAFQTLLSGYVATVRTGGSVDNFMKSKLRAAFELQTAITKQSIQTLGMIVDAYMSVMVIALSSFSMIVSMSAIDLPIGNLPPIEIINISVLIAIPLISAIFIVVAHTMRNSTIIHVDMMFKNYLFPLIGVAVLMIIIDFISDVHNIVIEYISLSNLLLVALIGVSIPPMIKYERMARINSSAERAMPIFIRSAVENRKTGLSPVKCIIQSSRGKNYGLFSKHLNMVADQLEWGVPLRRVFSNIRSDVKSWPVLMNIFILLEVIETGGGFADSLEALAESAERIQNLEEETKEMLRPYVILPIMVTALLSFTTIVLIQSFVSISTQPLEIITQLTITLSITIILQSWLTGFFIGKITSGAFAAGFKYAILLAVIAGLAIILTSQLDLNLGVNVGS